MVLWGNDVGRLHEGTSYQFFNVTVREYAYVKYLSLSELSTFNEVADIGEVVDVDDHHEPRSDESQAINGETSHVLGIDNYSSCKNCKAKVTRGECTKCTAKVKLSTCLTNFTARFIVGDK